MIVIYGKKNRLVLCSMATAFAFFLASPTLARDEGAPNDVNFPPFPTPQGNVGMDNNGRPSFPMPDGPVKMPAFPGPSDTFDAGMNKPAVPPRIDAPNIPSTPNKGAMPPSFAPAQHEMRKPLMQGKDDMFEGMPPPPPALQNKQAPRANTFPPTAPARGGMPERRGSPGMNNSANNGILDVTPKVCKPVTDKFYWNFKGDEDLSKILDQLSNMRCINFFLSDTVKPTTKVRIVGNVPLTPDAAWALFLKAMYENGLAVSHISEKNWAVSKRADAIAFPSKFVDDPSKAENNGQIFSLPYKAKHASQESLANVAKSLILPGGKVETFGDIIFIVDSGVSILRIGKIFEQIDVEDAINQVHVIKLEHADAKTVAKQLEDLYGAAAPSRFGRNKKTTEPQSPINIKTIIDERTNSIILLADVESLKKVNEFIQIIDRPASEGESKGKIHVKKLKFGDAESVADTLREVVQERSRSRNSFGRRPPGDSGASMFEGDVQITAHKDTNTLVTVAGANDYRALLKSIEELDTRQAQVHVEAIVLSINLNAESDFGLNMFTGMPATIPGMQGSSLGILGNPGGRGMVSSVATSMGASAAAGGAINPNLGAMAVLQNFVSGGVAGLVGPSLANGLPSFGAVLQAMAANANVDVISTPSLTTSDNKEAVISVGERVPVIKGVSPVGGAGAGGLGLSYPNVVYEDVKMTFKLTPHVGADDNIRLDISQEVSALGAKVTVFNEQQQYKIEQKNASTTLVLKDQQTGVIGGLISQSDSETINKVPFLGDIPLLGWFFKNIKKQKIKSNLVLIVTPYIIRSDADYEKLVSRKMKEREEFAKLYYGNTLKTYNKYIDYDKKAGPLASLINNINDKMLKVENGGPGSGDETVITPDSNSTEPSLEPKDIIFEEIKWEDIPATIKEDETLPLPQKSIEEPVAPEIKKDEEPKKIQEGDSVILKDEEKVVPLNENKKSDSLPVSLIEVQNQ